LRKKRIVHTEDTEGRTQRALRKSGRDKDNAETRRTLRIVEKRKLVCHPERSEGSAVHENERKADSSPRSKGERGSE
jgi:hypothetical protein